jgi:hypothetical protein
VLQWLKNKLAQLAALCTKVEGVGAIESGPISGQGVSRYARGDVNKHILLKIALHSSSTLPFHKQKVI